MPTPKENYKRLIELQRQESEVKERIANHARSVISILKDALRPHAAAELEALFSELDAKHVETIAHMDQSGPSILEPILDAFKRDRD